MFRIFLMNCRHCGSEHLVKDGIVKSKQRYKCKVCAERLEGVPNPLISWNAKIRRKLARFNRRTCRYSKAIDMAVASLTLLFNESPLLSIFS